MRVISGSLGGRVFDAPSSSKIHPMADKVRGSIFSSLGDISGLTVCDAYSGSGALAIEAISRGAKAVVAIESDHRAAKTIQTNLMTLGIKDSAKVIEQKIEVWLSYSADKFDVLLADPPYDHLPKDSTLADLASRLNKGGVMVLSWPGRHELPQLSGLTKLKTKSFNDASVGYYRKD